MRFPFDSVAMKNPPQHQTSRSIHNRSATIAVDCTPVPASPGLKYTLTKIRVVSRPKNSRSISCQGLLLCRKNAVTTPAAFTGFMTVSKRPNWYDPRLASEAAEYSRLPPLLLGKRQLAAVARRARDIIRRKPRQVRRGMCPRVLPNTTGQMFPAHHSLRPVNYLSVCRLFVSMENTKGGKSPIRHNPRMNVVLHHSMGTMANGHNLGGGCCIQGT